MKQKSFLTVFILYENVQQLPDRVCLYYHLDQCLAPCVNEVKEEEYQTIVDEITRFLNGGYREIKKELTEKMTACSGRT